MGIVTQYIDVTDESQVLTHHGLDSITAVRLQTAIAAALGVRLGPGLPKVDTSEIGPLGLGPVEYRYLNP
ncbi:acyl carrier protein [Corynebacterium macginleyi]|uniref:acyl carrier protein n=1 Tax=Corynebacterium macginleyi TaxID=38290 RepID=UPI00190DE379|nr:hypothetical protein [Corynebacterium macginleyi]MBK4162703.1 hypothetical protein [Corynebacterium macginleyi]MBK4167478.1 hypothetical protein [Corynebacterium macginleyi]